MEVIYSSKIIFMFFIVFTMLQAINTVLNTDVPLYITKVLHCPNIYIGYLSSFSAITEIPITIVLAMMSMKMDVRKLINIGILSGIVFLILLTQASNIYIVIGIHIIKSVFVSAFMSLGMAFFQNMIPEKYGISTVLYTNTTRAGNILGGMIMSLIGESFTYVFIVLLCICMFSLLLFNLTNYFVKRNNFISK